jgi:hypothetical protein
METVNTINVNEVKKELMKSKVNAKFSHYVSGNLYYTVELTEGNFQFPIEVVEEVEITDPSDYREDEEDNTELRLSSDLGTTSFLNEMRGSELNRWITKAIEKNEFIKIS